MLKKIKNGIWCISRKLKLEKALRKMWDMFKMYIYERARIYTYDPNLNRHVTYLFGHRVYPRTRKISSTELSQKKVFYFKVNRQAEYTIMCIQHWINAIQDFDYDFYFICDNKYLEREIVRYVYFRDENIKFIPSMRKKLQDVAKNLSSEYWKYATFAHLTPFYHAKEHGITNFWTIDADDTMFLVKPHRVAEILKNAERIAKKQNISAFSLDMWRSRTLCQHWSLGIVYIQDNDKFCRYFENTKDMRWTKPYKKISDAFNVDWFFNHLKDTEKVKVETFYVDNCRFIHWGYMLRAIVASSVYYWKNGKLLFPIIKYIYENETFGEVPIGDCIKIDIGITSEEGLSFMEHELSHMRYYSEEGRILNNLGDFGRVSEFFY